MAVMASSARAGRLIVRNLNFAVEEVNLKKAFSKYGKLDEVSLPKNAETNKKKGFGFVQFAERAD